MLTSLKRESFYLFGMGFRKKMIFKNHCLFGLEDQRVLVCFDEMKPVRILPGEYRVEIGDDAIWEDEAGVWIRKNGVVTMMTEGRVCLPFLMLVQSLCSMRS